MCGRYRLSRRKQIIEEYVDYIERKNLSDLVRSLMTDRAIFVGWLKKMSAHSHKTAGDHRWTELGEIAVPILPMQSQPCYAGTDLLLPICIKFTFTTGSNPTDTGDGWPTMFRSIFG